MSFGGQEMHRESHLRAENARLKSRVEELEAAVREIGTHKEGSAMTLVSERAFRDPMRLYATKEVER